MTLTLLDNEEIIYTLRKTKLIWLTPIFIGLITLIIYSGVSANPNPIGEFFSAIFFMWFLAELVRRMGYAGYVTNKRLVLHYGVFQHEKELRFEQLESVNIKRYLGLFWHQVNIHGTGGTDIFFDYVTNTNQFKSAIYDAKERYEQKHISNS